MRLIGARDLPIMAGTPGGPRRSLFLPPSPVIAFLRRPLPRLALTGAAVAAAACPLPALAQAEQMTMTLQPKWRVELTAGASVASGNNEATTFNFAGEARRTAEGSEWVLRGAALLARNGENTTADRQTVGTRYDLELSPLRFFFAQGDWLRDVPANLAQRVSVSTGNGVHLLRANRNEWDLLAGLGYSFDRLRRPDPGRRDRRSHDDRFELLLREESRHAVADGTTLKQALTLRPSLRNSGEYRAEFDSSISVAITRALSLTASFTVRHDTDPGTRVKPTDTLFVTGLSVKLD